MQVIVELVEAAIDDLVTAWEHIGAKPGFDKLRRASASQIAQTLGCQRMTRACVITPIVEVALGLRWSYVVDHN